MKPYLPAVILASLLMCASGRAVEVSPAATPAPESLSSQPVFFNVEFPGGPVSRLIGQVATVKGVSINIIATADQADLGTVLPAFTLRNATVVSVFEVARVMLVDRGLDLSTAGGFDHNSVTLLLRRLEPKPSSHSSDIFSSYQLGQYLSYQSIDDIVAAIHTAWELNPAHDSAALKLKFHPPTAILLVSGPPEAVSLAGNVLSQLRHGAAGEASPAAAPASATAMANMGVPDADRALEAYDVSKVDQKPVAKQQSRPRYPATMRQSHADGEVVVEFVVDTNGDVRDAHAVRATGPAFEASALEAVNQWKFQPGRKDGQAVNTRLQVPLVFTMRAD